MDLDRLIASEQRNEALIAAASAQAAALIDAAKGAAQSREQLFREAVAQAIAAAERQMAAELEQRVAEIEARARAEVARFDAVSDALIAGAVPGLVDRLLGGEAP